MKIKSAKGAKHKCDTLFSLHIRSIGYCENCFKKSGVQLQCAHINSRRFSATRTLLMNAFCLCAGCHRYYTDYPREFSKFITVTWAQEHYDQVFQLSRTYSKMNWMEQYEYLKDLTKEPLTYEQRVADLERTMEELWAESQAVNKLHKQ